MQLRISTSNGMPIYLQIVNQVKLLIASRRLSPGDEIPPIRTLANELLINPNTVARAYLELEREGLVLKRHGSGTFVSDGGSPLARKSGPIFWFRNRVIITDLSFDPIDRSALGPSRAIWRA